MADFSFADRYAEASLSPSAATISARQAPSERIIDDITSSQILDLAGLYYGSPGLDMTWLRDQFIQDDASFSLVNNEREAKLLSAVILGALVAAGNSVAMLAVISGSISGHRVPPLAPWLQNESADALKRIAVAERKPSAIETKIAPVGNAKLQEEISALVQNDWPTLITLLGKMRTEALAASKLVGTQTSTALSRLALQSRYQREENQMLWWLFGGHSRSLERSFASLGPQQAAIVGAVDLGDLSSVSRVGPVAAPAMLERVIALAKKAKGVQPRELQLAVEGLSTADLTRLRIFPDATLPWLRPITAALSFARDLGPGAWQARFSDRTGLQSTFSLEPLELAEQLYTEHLLGQLI